MPRRDPGVTILQMRDHAREALAMAKGRRRADLDSDRMFNLALVRLLEVLGEAASRVPPEARRLYAQVPWSELIGLRNRLIHAYDQVDAEILWQIVTQDLPGLVTELEKIARQEPG